ncbi:hypothetical protein P171DRAFT_431807 [Karstenula rhodostoma CBS 690.94]|uniref:EthD domain-containing protein n=1 Tax=Karstenula rhodostoma CBS 690.94 TaxID=1392251 RepID=A0A9P4UAZ4_9PLEO|nr:hypothetical protein P171DRAFT_431807 [Karstenula rhodostoma CBS 690.94]
MTYSVILHVPRRPSVSSEEFKHHWENIHIPLVKELVGYEFPLSYTRHYIERPFATPPVDPALDGSGAAVEESQSFGDVDGVAVLTFANREHYDKFSTKLVEAKRNSVYKQDLSGFVDVAALKALFAGETKATGRDGGMAGWTFVGSV